VFYDVSEDTDETVYVLAVALKLRNRVRRRHKDVEL